MPPRRRGRTFCDTKQPAGVRGLHLYNIGGRVVSHLRLPCDCLFILATSGFGCSDAAPSKSVFCNCAKHLRPPLSPLCEAVSSPRKTFIVSAVCMIHSIQYAFLVTTKARALSAVRVAARPTSAFSTSKLRTICRSYDSHMQPGAKRPHQADDGGQLLTRLSSCRPVKKQQQLLPGVSGAGASSLAAGADLAFLQHQQQQQPNAQAAALSPPAALGNAAAAQAGLTPGRAASTRRPAGVRPGAAVWWCSCRAVPCGHGQRQSGSHAQRNAPNASSGSRRHGHSAGRTPAAAAAAACAPASHSAASTVLARRCCRSRRCAR